MPKWRMAEIVGQSNRFGQILIQRQGPSNGAANGSHLDGMGQPGAQMVAGSVEENLGLVLEPAKSARMNDASAVPLKLGPIGMTRFRILPAPGITRFLGKRGQDLDVPSLPFPGATCSRRGQAARSFSGPVACRFSLSSYRSEPVLRGFESVSIRSRNRCRSLRSSTLTLSKSKIARSIADRVSQPQASQNNRNQARCSRTFRTGARKVEPQTSNKRAAISRPNMV